MTPLDFPLTYVRPMSVDHLRMSEGYDHADAVRGSLDADVDDLTTGVIFVGLAVLALGLFMWGAM